MKSFRKFGLLAFILSALSLVLFSSCSKDSTTTTTDDDDDETETVTTPYTVTLMIYGCGGSNLDDGYEQVLLESMRKLEEDDLLGGSVKITSCFRYSTDTSKTFISAEKKAQENVYGVRGKAGCTYLFQVDPEDGGYFEKRLSSSYLSDPNDYFLPDSLLIAKGYEDVTDQATLTYFLNWSKKNAPSDKYVLIFENHGGGYLPYYEIPEDETKCVLYDDNVKVNVFYTNDGRVEATSKKNLTLDAIKKGVSKSDLSTLDLLYFNLCICNSIEIVSEVSSIASYVLASEHETNNGATLNYYKIGKALANLETEDALSSHVDYMMNAMSIESKDFFATRTSAIPGVLDAVSDFREVLMDLSPEDSLRTAINACYQPSNGNTSPYFDLTSFIYECVRKFPDNEALSSVFDKYVAAMQNARVASKYLTPHYAYDEKEIIPSWTVNIVKNAEWLYDGSDDKGETITFSFRWDGHVYLGNADYGYWCSNGDSTYGSLVFDKRTSWSEWLKANDFLPTGNPYDKGDASEVEQEDSGLDYLDLSLAD